MDYNDRRKIWQNTWRKIIGSQSIFIICDWTDHWLRVQSNCVYMIAWLTADKMGVDSLFMVMVEEELLLVILLTVFFVRADLCKVLYLYFFQGGKFVALGAYHGDLFSVQLGFKHTHLPKPTCMKPQFFCWNQILQPTLWTPVLLVINWGWTCTARGSDHGGHGNDRSRPNIAGHLSRAMWDVCKWRARVGMICVNELQWLVELSWIQCSSCWGNVEQFVCLSVEHCIPMTSWTVASFEETGWLRTSKQWYAGHQSLMKCLRIFKTHQTTIFEHYPKISRLGNSRNS